jgi:hypothetical protein
MGAIDGEHVTKNEKSMTDDWGVMGGGRMD